MSDENNFKIISGSICAPRGFKAAAVFCDIKKLGTGKGSEKGQKRDLALIVADVPAAVAGMFTTNQVCAAPVKVSAKRAAKKLARAIVVNSGNANACTGRQGIADAQQMARLTAASVAALYERRKNSSDPECFRGRYRRITGDDVLVCSTGRIGVPMPMKNVERGIRECAPLLARSTTNARQVADAIMTTDTRRKEIAVEFKIDNRAVRIGGICKGAGMIEPGMAVATGLRPVGTKHATMLAFITSDAAIESNALKRALEAAVAQSFNRITVDGDMSTNDSVIALANGLAGNSKSEIRRSQFQNALNFVCLELAKMIVKDFYSPSDAERAEDEFNRIFRSKGVPDEISTFEVETGGGPWALPRLLVTTGLAPSVAEARRLIEQGGVRVNGEPQTNKSGLVFVIKTGDELLLQVGKRRFLRVRGV